MAMNHSKYRPLPHFDFPQRTWPSKAITHAPIWCSTDLRDGNQALEVPMTLAQKLAYFSVLTDIGFKQIEVAFPSASDTEFDLVRTLIEKDLIPDDVTIQVLTQARDHLIERTFESLRGVRHAIVHLYTSTCPLHRDVVFNMSKQQVTEMTRRGAQQFVDLAQRYGKERFTFEYSPETFSATEMEYAIELCNHVLDIWQPTPEHPAIINLPATVEGTTPNVYADQIEYVAARLSRRDGVQISLHAHNDRGTGVAATELALMAGADRVEGTLFGNGERTGNVDIVTLALNMYTNGIDPLLDFSHIDQIIATYESTTQMSVPPRQPYAGELVYTAFSGSHQDAIKKGMARLGTDYDLWRMPYLTIDPADLGRSYEALIRVNSQSGKGGVFFLLEQAYGITAPKALQQEFGGIITRISDSASKELSADELYAAFEAHYIPDGPYALVSLHETVLGADSTNVRATIRDHGVERTIDGEGNGLMDAFCNAMRDALGLRFDIRDYAQHALSVGSGSKAMSYVCLVDGDDARHWGVGISSNVSKSSVRALISAVNRIASTN